MRRGSKFCSKKLITPSTCDYHTMKNVVILDLDGVLITTPSWKADEIHPDGYSDFNKEAVHALNSLLEEIEAELWLSSTRRLNQTLEGFRTIFNNRSIKKELAGFLPGGTRGLKRRVEIEAFLNCEPIDNFIIVDDDQSLQELDETRKDFWVRTDPLIGFNTEKLNEAREKIKNWSQ